MLATITIFGMSLLWWYMASVVMSFCTTMAGDSYLKKSGAMPENFNHYIPGLIVSLVPIFNVIFAIKTFRLGLACWRDPEARDIYRAVFTTVEEEFSKELQKLTKKGKDAGSEGKEDEKGEKDEENEV